MKLKDKITFALISIGILLSGYLTVEYFDPKILVCSTIGVINCPYVLNSTYSKILGIPLAMIGLVWVLGTLILKINTKNKKANFLIPIWLLLGIIGVVYSFTAQYVLGHICEYCFSLDITIILIVIMMIKDKGFS